MEQAGLRCHNVQYTSRDSPSPHVQSSLYTYSLHQAISSSLLADELPGLKLVHPLQMEVSHTLLSLCSRNFQHTKTSEKLFLCCPWRKELAMALPTCSLSPSRGDPWSHTCFWQGSPAPSDDCSQAVVLFRAFGSSSPNL